MDYDELLGRVARVIAKDRHDTILAFEVDVDLAKDILTVVYEALSQPSPEMIQSARLIPIVGTNHNIGDLLDENQIRSIFAAGIAASPLHVAGDNL